MERGLRPEVARGTFPEDPPAIRTGFFATIAERAGGREMIGLLPTTAIFLATAPTDLRKAYDPKNGS